MAGILATLVVAVARWWLDPIFGTVAAYRIFFIAIVFTAWYADLVPALLSLILGFFLAAYLFDDTRGTVTSYSVNDRITCAFYFIVGTSLAVLVSGLTRPSPGGSKLKRNSYARTRNCISVKPN